MHIYKTVAGVENCLKKRVLLRFQTRRRRRVVVARSHRLTFASTSSDAFARSTARRHSKGKHRQRQRQRRWTTRNNIPIPNRSKRCRKTIWAVPYLIWSPVSRRSVRATSRDRLRSRTRERKVRCGTSAWKRATYTGVPYAIVPTHTSAISAGTTSPHTSLTSSTILVQFVLRNSRGKITWSPTLKSYIALSRTWVLAAVAAVVWASSGRPLSVRPLFSGYVPWLFPFVLSLEKQSKITVTDRSSHVSGETFSTGGA